MNVGDTVKVVNVSDPVAMKTLLGKTGVITSIDSGYWLSIEGVQIRFHSWEIEAVLNDGN